MNAMGLLDDIILNVSKKTGGVANIGGLEGRIYLRDFLPTYSIKDNSIVIDPKDLWPSGTVDRHPITLHFDEIDTIRVLKPGGDFIPPPERYALDASSHIMDRFSGGKAAGNEEKAGWVNYLASIGQSQVDVLKLLKEGTAAYLEGRINRPPVYITCGTKEQIVYLDGKSLCITKGRGWVVDTVGVPVIIEGPTFFYYIFFNAGNADDLVTAFREYNVKARQGSK